MGAGIGTGTVSVKGASLQAEAAAVVAAFQRISERIDRPVGLPMPARFQEALEFGVKHLAMGRSQTPPVRFVADGALRDGARACYHVKRGEISIVAGQSDADTVACLFHELTHHYESLKGWQASEGFATAMETDLMAKWLPHLEALT